jgi:hypothetical protein
MPADVNQLRDLIGRIDDHQEKLAQALVTLEKRLTDLMGQAPLMDGQLFDLEWSIAARSEVRAIIQKEYLSAVDGLVREYNAVAVEVSDMLSNYGDFVKLDKGVVSQLQTLTFKGFEDLGDQYLDIVSKEIYQNTLTGTAFGESVKIIQNSVDAKLGRYASQQLHDGLMQFDAAINIKIAKDTGATKFKYYGQNDEVTRDFCSKHVGKTYTEEQIKEIWKGNWSGKINGDPFIVRGGYNCRHRFRPVI